MATAACALDTTARAISCRYSTTATHLKLISIITIFLTSVSGISSPILLARFFAGKPIYDQAILLIKSFAAGVILSTSLVHVSPDAYEALSDCAVASHHPWKDFPFSGFTTMIGALLALLVDITATSHVEPHVSRNKPGEYLPIGNASLENLEKSGEAEGEELARIKQKLVSQVLEIGIIFHSVIIGVTMGMSQNFCTIRTLVAALAFHQIFEGMGLGGCIAQASFRIGTTAYMCFMFSVTTPMGILLGMIIFWITGYDDSNPNALVMEGLLGSVSSGILIYMALVDLIAAEFFHNKSMSCNQRLKKASYVALIFGSFSMSILALWA